MRKKKENVEDYFPYMQMMLCMQGLIAVRVVGGKKDGEFVFEVYSSTRPLGNQLNFFLNK